MSPMHCSIVEAPKLFFKNYTNFSGRSTRSEFWWWILYNLVVVLLLNVLTMNVSQNLGILSGIWGLATIVPGIALCIRRLHDVGRPGTHLLFGLIPVAGAIFLILQYVKESDGENQWGKPASN